MTQHPALSVEMVDRTDVLADTWERARQDGVICPVEITTVTALIAAVATQAGLVDLAQAAGLAIIRRGADAYRPRELLGQLDQQEAA